MWNQTVRIGRRRSRFVRCNKQNLTMFAAICFLPATAAVATDCALVERIVAHVRREVPDMKQISFSRLPFVASLDAPVSCGIEGVTTDGPDAGIVLQVLAGPPTADGSIHFSVVVKDSNSPGNPLGVRTWGTATPGGGWTIRKTLGEPLRRRSPVDTRQGTLTPSEASKTSTPGPQGHSLDGGMRDKALSPSPRGCKAESDVAP